MTHNFLKAVSDEDLLEMTLRALFLEKLRRYADLHHMAHQKLVTAALQTTGRYDLLPKIKGTGDAQLKTLERFEQFYRDHPDGPPETIRVKL